MFVSQAKYSKRLNRFFIRLVIYSLGFILTTALPYQASSKSFLSSNEAQAASGKKRSSKARKVRSRSVLRRFVPPVQPEAIKNLPPVEAVAIPQAELSFRSGGKPLLSNVASVSRLSSATPIIEDQAGNRVQLTLDADLQAKAVELLSRYRVPWGAIVAMDPRSGRILALASFSTQDPNGENLLTRASFPAASLFKLVTAAAAIEKSGMSGADTVYFRGGNYTLGPQNAFPDPLRDRRSMSFGEALGKSCNPVFARVALNSLSNPVIERYAQNFGFNAELPFDTAVDVSQFSSAADHYELARTAAGFGPVTLSPLHAAVLTSAIANRGVMMRPYVIDKVYSKEGKLLYEARVSPIRVAILSSTARELLNMMEQTVETGTAKRQFLRVKNPLLRSTAIAAKTGTLSGDNPKGVYHWFVAAAPSENPEIVVTTLIIDPGGARVKSSALGRELLELHFQRREGRMETSREIKRKLG